TRSTPTRRRSTAGRSLRRASSFRPERPTGFPPRSPGSRRSRRAEQGQTLRCLSLLYRGRTATGLPHDEDPKRLEARRAGDERAFAELLAKYGPSMLRIALMYVSSQAVAEEVVQETWLAVFTGLERFEGRSTLKTWLFRILTNKAKTRGQREGRTLPFSALAADRDEEATAVDVDRFLGPDNRHAGHWAAPPRGVPEERLLAGEARAKIEAAIDALPPNQRTVIT